MASTVESYDLEGAAEQLAASLKECVARVVATKIEALGLGAETVDLPGDRWRCW